MSARTDRRGSIQRGRLRGRAGRTVAALVALLAGGAAVGACGNSARSLAQQACAHVDTSLADLHRAETATDPAAAARYRQRAYTELLHATPIAAQAARVDGQWQALEFTISEANRVPEAQLAPSLRSLCAAAERTVFDQLPPPTAPPTTRSAP